nr:truncated transporter-related protein [Tanacetum cinerariifolium]
GIVERYGWRLLFGVSSLPSLVALLFYTLVPESPRFLYAKGELGEASKILNWGVELNKRQLPEGRLISANTDESTHNVQPSINTPSAPPMIVEVSRVNESKESTSGTEKAEGKDKTIAGEIQIDEAHHTLKKDDPVDRAGPRNSRAIFGIFDDGDLRTKNVHYPLLSCKFIQKRTLGAGVAIVVGRIGSIVLPLVREGMLSYDGNKTPAMIMFAFKISVCMVCALLLPIETRGRVLKDD